MLLINLVELLYTASQLYFEIKIKNFSLVCVFERFFFLNMDTFFLFSLCLHWCGEVKSSFLSKWIYNDASTKTVKWIADIYKNLQM